MSANRNNLQVGIQSTTSSMGKHISNAETHQIPCMAIKAEQGYQVNDEDKK